jgi:hypothetical protein
MSTAEHVKEWRRNTKLRMVKAMGGKCAICEYSRTTTAFDFHHLDPSGKDFNISATRANPTSWAKLVEELRKCVMLCANCHREVHSGEAVVPPDYLRFDESYLDYKTLEQQQKKEPCPVCGVSKPKRLVTCSRACAGKQSGKIDWDQYDVAALCEANSYEAVGRMLGCTGAAVKKRLNKLTNHFVSQ